jgi:hypothetical protein
MRAPDVGLLFEVVRAADPDVMERDELAELTSSIAALKAWCDAVQVRATRRIGLLAAEGRAEAAKDLLAAHGRQSGKEARDADERERVCTSLPNFEDALGAGAVSAGHVDAIAHATRGMDGSALAEFNALADDLLADAQRCSVDVFERNCKDLATFVKASQPGASDADELAAQRKASSVKRWTDKASGMRMTLLKLDPVRDAIWWAGIKRAKGQVQRRPGGDKLDWEQLLVDAVVEAAQPCSNSGDGRVATHLHVLIDYDTLVNGLHANSVSELSDGTRLPVSVIRHMACQAEIIPIVLDGQGQALDVGRSQRLATEAQRQALRAMYSTCAIPGCATPVDDCHVHHVDHFEDGGNTNLDRMLPLCILGGCHTRVHEGGWTLEMDPDDRSITILRPDGTLHYQGPSINLAPNGIARTTTTTTTATTATAA